MLCLERPPAWAYSNLMLVFPQGSLWASTFHICSFCSLSSWYFSTFSCSFLGLPHLSQLTFFCLSATTMSPWNCLKLNSCRILALLFSSSFACMFHVDFAYIGQRSICTLSLLYNRSAADQFYFISPWVYSDKVHNTILLQWNVLLGNLALWHSCGC